MVRLKSWEKYEFNSISVFYPHFKGLLEGTLKRDESFNSALRGPQFFPIIKKINEFNI